MTEEALQEKAILLIFGHNQVQRDPKFSITHQPRTMASAKFAFTTATAKSSQPPYQSP
jgi:hypothetical protein